MNRQRGIGPVPEKQTSEARSAALSLALPEDLSAALDRLVGQQAPGTTREEMMVCVFREWATARGLVAGTDEGKRPDELNASNDD